MINKKHISIYSFPWMIISAAAILLVIVVSLAVSNHNREKQYMSQILLEKGAALIKSFEAGTRTGMRAMGWNENQVQYLLQELADQADVLYIAITDINGRILAHSDPEQINARFFVKSGDQEALNPGESAKWQLTKTQSGKPAFEVYSFFNPFSGRNANRRQMGHLRQFAPRPGRAQQGRSWRIPDNSEENKQIIFIGFDRTPFIEARQQDIKITAIISLVLFILGFTGMAIMLIARNYRTTRQRLQDTSAMADQVVASLPVGLMVTDAEGRIVLHNPAAESITGLDAKSVRGQFADEMLPDNLAQLICRQQADKQIMEHELECIFLPGQKRVPLSVSSTGIINEDGAFIGSMVILRDLTEIKDLQQTVQRKEKLAAVGELAAGIAHEIRNPLSSVKGMATYFKARYAQDPEARDAAAVMVQETDRLNRVISELLEFARPSEINARPADINPVLDHSLHLVRQEAAEKNIDIRISKGQNLPHADIDSDRFIQCLLNLYLNAIQSMESSGILKVTSSPGTDENIVIQVQDNGPGIDRADLAKIFDPYFTTKASGTGLGLAIVHKIVESHNGRITVKSSPEEGTVFTITLPASANAATKEA
ncbi:two-component system sensor histidine kinase HydH [Desulfosalsimonas propionicica]|uniref:histidine kinase n=1 Tax=Desulfosalsimonas propionicica TaxID=332175 RepID=A0A7W0HLF3_9BACT|nr:ATP-binding protein [Desulfosalsimonas propionicica]MBA2882274.1 two-component system sensor histidine kinase HydH [Desulfosalsimonas propionicica]